jgi:hypothetical protein
LGAVGFGDAGAAAFGTGVLVSCATTGDPIKAIPTRAANGANRVIVISMSLSSLLGADNAAALGTPASLAPRLACANRAAGRQKGSAYCVEATDNAGVLPHAAAQRFS